MNLSKSTKRSLRKMLRLRDKKISKLERLIWLYDLTSRSKQWKQWVKLDQERKEIRNRLKYYDR